jgi:hypothetical protein
MTDSRDAAFYDAFHECLHSQGDKALERLRALAAAGATTAAFEDDELSSAPNFADAVRAWAEDERGSARFVQAAAIVIERGSAFLTNRSYVGNGGAPAASFVLSAIANGSAPTHALELLELMLAKGLRLAQYFWGDFIANLRAPRSPNQETELHRAVIRLAEEQGVLAFDVDSLTRLFEHGNPLRRLLQNSRDEVVRLLVEAAARSTKPGAFNEPGALDELTDTLLNPFLMSKRHRALLITLARHFGCVKTWLTQPRVVTSLVQKKERSTLQWLLHNAPETLKSMRDESGNSLLHVLASVRGKTEKIAELFVEAGFDVTERNAFGRTAIDEAEARRNHRLALALNDTK